MNLRILLLKTEKLSDFLKWGSGKVFEKVAIYAWKGEVMHNSSRV